MLALRKFVKMDANEITNYIESVNFLGKILMDGADKKIIGGIDKVLEISGCNWEQKRCSLIKKAHSCGITGFACSVDSSRSEVMILALRHLSRQEYIIASFITINTRTGTVISITDGTAHEIESISHYKDAFD